MRVIEQTIYKYSELDDSAKARAKEWFSQGGYTWIDEGIESVRAFCRALRLPDKLDYDLSPYSHSYIDSDVTPAYFRGLKLKDIDREAMPTGYCLDCDCFYTFYDTFKETGNAYEAFIAALDAAKKAIIAEMEYQDSEEYIQEMMEINGYEFDEQGRIA